MNAGHFSESHVSSGDLNRPRSPEVRKPLACFLVLFARRKKYQKPFPFRELPRFRKPRCSSPQWRLRTNLIKSFCRFAAYFRLTAVLCGCAAFLVACGNRLPPTAAKNTACRPFRTARRAPHSTSCKAAYPSSPVRTLTTFSTLYTKILPSPI